MKKKIMTGASTFTLKLPYKLFEVGEQADKPLIVYLHGYKQNMHLFERKVSELFSIEACHLLLQGPYPIYDEKHSRKVDQWGRAWYLYDGEQEQFLESLEESSQYIQQVIEELRDLIEFKRIAVLGYSMGGYLAGYFALSRPRYIDDLIVIGGRIKTEHFKGNNYENLRVLALHGAKDRAVASSREKKSCKELQKMGALVTFKEIQQGHRLNFSYTCEVKDWLNAQSY